MKNRTPWRVHTPKIKSEKEKTIMAEDNFAMGYALGQDSNGNNNGGMFGNDGWWGIILLALLFGWGNGNGFGNNGGGFGFGAGAPWATQADVRAAVDQQTLVSKMDQQTYGIADATYALNNTITNGFHGVDNALCSIGHQISDCCCTTQRAIDGVNYNMAKGFCDLNNAINMQTRDIIENQNANYRGLMDFMVQSKLDNLRTENEALRLRVSQSDQNAVLRAAIDASTAEIIRRTGNECPVPAYVVPNPNCCYGNPVGVSYNGYNNGGCGCGC